jgi:hypothetical protein
MEMSSKFVSISQKKKSTLDIFDDVKLWWDNPRTQGLGLTHDSTQEEIETALFTMSDVNELYELIVKDGYIQEDVEVFRDANGDLVASEGNCRVACGRRGFREGKLKKRVHYFAEVNPDSIPSRLMNTHIRGKNRWSSYNQCIFQYKEIFKDSPSESEVEKRIKDAAQLCGETPFLIRRKFEAMDIYKQHIAENDGTSISESLFKLYDHALGFPGSGIADHIRTNEGRNEFDSWYRDGRMSNQYHINEIAGFWSNPKARALFREGESIQGVKDYVKHDNQDAKDWLKKLIQNQLPSKINDDKIKASANDPEWRALMNQAASFFSTKLDLTDYYAEQTENNSANRKSPNDLDAATVVSGNNYGESYTMKGSVLKTLFSDERGPAIVPRNGLHSDDTPDMRDMFSPKAKKKDFYGHCQH